MQNHWIVVYNVVIMTSQKQTHTPEAAPSQGVALRLREAASIRRSKKAKHDIEYNSNTDIESNSKLTRENDAAALLLGLAHSIGSPSCLKESKEEVQQDPLLQRSPHLKDRIGENENDLDTSGDGSKSITMDPDVMKLLTAKGHGRLGPGDNRVRPPKAATKLLDTKWRHIRLPSIQAALEAEDWVVMYGHLKDPGSLSKDKMNTMLNFHPSHYDEGTVNEKIFSLKNAMELERFLKDRYSGGTQKKNRSSHRNLQLHGARSLRRGDSNVYAVNGNFKEISSMPNMKTTYDDGSPQRVSVEAVKSGVPLLANQFVSLSDRNDRIRQESSKAAPINGLTSLLGSEGTTFGTKRYLSSQSLPINSYDGLPWPMLQNPSTVTDISRSHGPCGPPSGYPKSILNRQKTAEKVHQIHDASILTQYTKLNVTSAGKCSARSPDHNVDKQGVNASGDIDSEDAHDLPIDTDIAGVYKPGRPPSYDAMVKWCVDLKRVLFQRKVTLTIDEAITLVNDPIVYACGPKTAHTKSLVASTLRKRVLGIYGITWSQVATTLDKDVNKDIHDKDILNAATNILNRHGLNLSGRLLSAEFSKGNPIEFSDHINKDCAVLSQGSGHLKDSKALEAPGRVFHSTDEILNNDTTVNRCLVVEDLLGLSDTVKKIIKKAETQFLNFEEVAIIIKNAAQGKLPVSLQVNYQPKSGTLYLINRSKVAKFRCDGYEFKKRETHARKMLSSNERLNCYYAGGTTDNMQRRCYWLVSDDCDRVEEESVTRPKDLVLIHYINQSVWNDMPSKLDSSDVFGEKESFHSKEKLMKQKEELEQKIAELNELLSH